MANFFNDATVGAFFGALFAFLLVAFTDWRRAERKAKKDIPNLVRGIGEQAQLRREDLKEIVANAQSGKIELFYVDDFPTERLRAMLDEVGDRLARSDESSLRTLILGMASANAMSQRMRELLDRLDELAINVTNIDASPARLSEMISATARRQQLECVAIAAIAKGFTGGGPR